MKGFDLGKYISRKFLVFVIATILLLAGKLSEQIWLYLALAYMGVEGILDLIRSNNNDKN